MKNKYSFSSLHIEYKTYHILQGAIGIPKIFWYGSEGDFNFLVMELLGPSLEELLNFCRKKLTLRTVIAIFEQLISRIECVHALNITHRDIKPENFVLGLNDNENTIYLIDFGLSKFYRDPKTKIHIPYKDNKKMTGTARFASINTHLGVEQSRRDDLECLAYTIIYLYKGELPWQGLKANTKSEKYSKIRDKKTVTSMDSLCSGMPKEILNIVSYIRSLTFDEKPDYIALKKLLTEYFIRNEFFNHFQFDWTVRKREKNFKDDRSITTSFTKLEYLIRGEDTVYINYPPSDLKKYICNTENFKRNFHVLKDYNSKQSENSNEFNISNIAINLNENDSDPPSIPEEQIKPLASILQKSKIIHNEDHFKKYRHKRINQNLFIEARSFNYGNSFLYNDFRSVKSCLDDIDKLSNNTLKKEILVKAKIKQ